MTALADLDRRLIADARALAVFARHDGLREHLTDAGLMKPGEIGGDDLYPFAFGAARSMLGHLADLAERLGGGEGQAAEDARRLGEIRALLARFDWEHDDRQYALEAIERIADGGQAHWEPSP